MTDRHPVVLLTGTDAQHRFVARALADGPGLDALVLVVGERRPGRLRRARRRFGIGGLLRGISYKAAMRLTGEDGRQAREFLRILGPSPLPHGVPTHTVAHVNRAETLDLLDRLQPEILCVYGTSIVRDDTLAKASRIALNLHTGISPRYRGADCAFWPLYDTQPQCIGATVHVCTSAIDGGDVYGTVRARLASGDRVGGVYARAVADGAALYADVVGGILAGTADSTPQDLSVGGEFRVAMRSTRAEVAVWRKVRSGLVREYVKAGQPADWIERTER